jgi:hypothetical protein
MDTALEPMMRSLTLLELTTSEPKAANDLPDVIRNCPRELKG